MKNVKSFLTGEIIEDIQDITDFVKEQRGFAKSNQLDQLIVPEERIFSLDPILERRIDADEAQ
mgnify:CR=1 FL=1